MLPAKDVGLFSTSEDGTVRVSDLERRKLVHECRLHTGPVHAVSASPPSVAPFCRSAVTSLFQCSTAGAAGLVGFMPLSLPPVMWHECREGGKTQAGGHRRLLGCLLSHAWGSPWHSSFNFSAACARSLHPSNALPCFRSL